MDEYPRESVVYYLDERAIALADNRRRLKKIDEQIKNTREDMALLKVTEESLGKIEALLGHMRRLAALAASDDQELDRDFLDSQFQSLKNDIGDVVASAGYKGANLLDGSFGSLDNIIHALGETML